MTLLQDMIDRHEGRRLKPYVDCCGKAWKLCTCKVKGKLTIGAGRNLDDVGISESECDLLRDNDIQAALVASVRAFPWFKRLNPSRQDAIVDMVLNLGVERFKGFQNTIEALAAGVYDVAAQQMLISKWARQVGARATELAEMIRTGAYVPRKR